MFDRESAPPDQDHAIARAARLAGMALGPLAFVATLLLPAPVGMPPAAWPVAGLALWMAVWWITEAVPLPATALLPIVFLPTTGAVSVVQATAPFANPLIFLFLGGFLIALAMERWNLHRRMALAILSRLPERPAMLVAGFMVVSAFLSMWVSNTATTLMLLPIGLSVVNLLAEDHAETGHDFPLALMLGLAYAASIGGIATLVGTPPNALVAGIMAENYGIEVGFARWMAAALPLSLAMLAIGWFVLARVVCRLPKGELPGVADMMANRYRALGPMGVAERRVALVAGLTALLWIVNPLTDDILGKDALSDTGIAIGAAIVLFLLPSGTDKAKRLLDWDTAKRAPWAVLILFGGGLSLAHAIALTGLADWIGLGLRDLALWPLVLVIGAMVTIIVFLTEVTSNTATSAAFIPIASALALVFGLSPLDLAAPVAVAASCAFMLPVATPPNAIVYASGQVTVAQMARAGFLLNLAAIVLITLYLPWALHQMFG
jgi:sodium-dependent dicarboxylate transporter 2/3/5